MLEFKFDEKLSNWDDIPAVLTVLKDATSDELQARTDSPELQKPSLIAMKLVAANIDGPTDTSRTWRSHWSEIVLYGLVYWDYSVTPPILKLTPCGENVLEETQNLNVTLLKTFSRLQFPHPLKTIESNFVPFLKGKVRVVPVRRAARVLRELASFAQSQVIGETDVYLTDSELYYVWACPDWGEIPDGDPLEAAQRVVKARKGEGIRHYDLLNVEARWLSRLANRIGKLIGFKRLSGSRIGIEDGALEASPFVDAMFSNTSYFAWTERAVEFNGDAVKFPLALYTAWGLYHGAIRGDEYLQLQPLVVEAPKIDVSEPQINADESYEFTFQQSVWDKNIAPVGSGLISDIVDGWIINNKDRYAYRSNTVKRAVIALLEGHVLFQGPPGTGKTELASELTQLFGACLRVATATPDWTTADTVGGISLSEQNAMTVEPNNGIVTNSILDCARLAYLENEFDHGCVTASPNAIWLLIDEINRSEIDKVFGGLMTAMSSSASNPLELHFQTTTAKQRVRVPNNFRLLATANTFDKAYVNGMSQALVRRFSMINIDVPVGPQGEWDLEEEVTRLENGFTPEDAGSISHEALVALKRTEHVGGDLSQTVRLTALGRIYKAVLVLRYGNGTPIVPVGTAQVIATLSYALRLIADGINPEEAGAEALATRVLGQTDFLSRTQLEMLAQSLKNVGDDRSATEILDIAHRLPTLL